MTRRMRKSHPGRAHHAYTIKRRTAAEMDVVRREQAAVKTKKEEEHKANEAKMNKAVYRVAQIVKKIRDKDIHTTPTMKSHRGGHFNEPAQDEAEETDLDTRDEDFVMEKDLEENGKDEDEEMPAGDNSSAEWEKIPSSHDEASENEAIIAVRKSRRKRKADSRGSSPVYEMIDIPESSDELPRKKSRTAASKAKKTDAASEDKEVVRDKSKVKAKAKAKETGKVKGVAEKGKSETPTLRQQINHKVCRKFAPFERIILLILLIPLLDFSEDIVGRASFQEVCFKFKFVNVLKTEDSILLQHLDHPQVLCQGFIPLHHLGNRTPLHPEKKKTRRHGSHGS